MSNQIMVPMTGTAIFTIPDTLDPVAVMDAIRDGTLLVKCINDENPVGEVLDQGLSHWTPKWAVVSADSGEIVFHCEVAQEGMTAQMDPKDWDGEYDPTLWNMMWEGFSDN